MRKGFLFILSLILLCSVASEGSWYPQYSVDGDMDGPPYRFRGLAVFGEHEVAAAYGEAGYSSHSLVVYTNAHLSNSDGVYSMSASTETWTNPDYTTDTVGTYGGWGCVSNPLDGGIYATFGGAQCPIVGWDLNCNSLNKAAQTRLPDSGISHTSAMDVDNAGNFYVVCYGSDFWDDPAEPLPEDGWSTPTVAQYADMIKLPPTTDPAWLGTDLLDASHSSGHNPIPIASIDCDGDWDINEGICAKPSGLVVWITNRAGSGTGEWVYRYVAGGPYGYTKDTSFSFVKNNNSPMLRAIDCTSDGLEIYTTWDGGTPDGVVQVNNGVTGDLINVIDINTPAAGLCGTLSSHSSPYDIEITSLPFGMPSVAHDWNPKNMWIQHYSSGYIDKWYLPVGTYNPWFPQYSVDGDMDGLPYRVRGIAVFGDDDVAGVYGRPGYTTYTLCIYNDADLSPYDGVYSMSAAAERWVNPDSPTTDTQEADWAWGCVNNPKDGGIYATFGRDQCPILSWDTNANSLNKAAQTRMPDVSIQYTSAMDIDDAGNFYVAAYGSWFDGWSTPTVVSGADVIVLPPTTDAAWTGTNINDPTHSSGHNPTPIGSIDCDGDWDINEGVCVKPDGSVVWITNRTGTGTGEWVYRYVAGGPFGWTKDTSFSFVKANDAPTIRGIDCTSDGLEIYSCFDDGTLNGCVQVNNGVTGDFILLIEVNSPASGLSGTLYDHNSPYDIEITGFRYGSPTQAGIHSKNMWIAHYWSWYIDRWQLYIPSVSDWPLY